MSDDEVTRTGSARRRSTKLTLEDTDDEDGVEVGIVGDNVGSANIFDSSDDEDYGEGQAATVSEAGADTFRFDQQKIKEAMTALCSYLDPSPAPEAIPWSSVIEKGMKVKQLKDLAAYLVEYAHKISWEAKCLVASGVVQIMLSGDKKNARDVFKSKSSDSLAHLISSVWLDECLRLCGQQDATSDSLTEKEDYRCIFLVQAMKFIRSSFVIKTSRQLEILKDKQGLDWVRATRNTLQVATNRTKWTELKATATDAREHLRLISSGESPAPVSSTHQSPVPASGTQAQPPASSDAALPSKSIGGSSSRPDDEARKARLRRIRMEKMRQGLASVGGNLGGGSGGMPPAAVLPSTSYTRVPPSRPPHTGAAQAAPTPAVTAAPSASMRPIHDAIDSARATAPNGLEDKDQRQAQTMQTEAAPPPASSTSHGHGALQNASDWGTGTVDELKQQYAQRVAQSKHVPAWNAKSLDNIHEERREAALEEIASTQKDSMCAKRWERLQAPSQNRSKDRFSSGSFPPTSTERGPYSPSPNSDNESTRNIDHHDTGSFSATTATAQKQGWVSASSQAPRDGVAARPYSQSGAVAAEPENAQAPVGYGSDTRKRPRDDANQADDGWRPSRRYQSDHGSEFAPVIPGSFHDGAHSSAVVPPPQHNRVAERGVDRNPPSVLEKREADEYRQNIANGGNRGRNFSDGRRSDGNRMSSVGNAVGGHVLGNESNHSGAGRGRGRRQTLPAWMTQQQTHPHSQEPPAAVPTAMPGPPQAPAQQQQRSIGGGYNRPPAFNASARPMPAGRGRGRGKDLTLPAWMTKGRD